jgi:hypothetical protein
MTDVPGSLVAQDHGHHDGCPDDRPSHPGPRPHLRHRQQDEEQDPMTPVWYRPASCPVAVTAAELVGGE